MDVVEREGADITAADMVNHLTEPSNIQQYFTESTVFVTGGTGFLGKLLIEKLLRTCHDLKKIYILVRPKKGKTSEERFQQYFGDSLYDRLKREQSQSMHKLCVIAGDCSLPNLGISNEDREILISEVNCVFHCAATLHFEDKLRVATYVNVRATKEILKLAKTVKDLRSIIYMSTAYSFCPRREIYEAFYDPSLTGDKLLTLVETLNDDMLTGIVPVILGEWPNTYTFTKSIAEDIVRKESYNLPIAIVRPSIVVATAKDPVAGWISNCCGATGIIVGAILGLIRTIHCEPNNLADLVPADYVINCALAAAWDIAMRKSLNLNEEITRTSTEDYKEDSDSNIPIYNYVSAPQKPITWRDCLQLGNRQVNSVPTTYQIWHFWFWFNSNQYVHLFCHYMLHIFPAYIVDFLAFCVGKQPRLVEVYKKIEKFLNDIAYLSSQQWIFRNYNTQALWNKLNSEDKKFYEFNIANLDWDLYFHTFTRGSRVYLLKDSLDTIPQGQAKRFKLKIAHYTLLTIFFLSLLQVLVLIF